MAVLAKFIPLIYVLREGKPGSLRSVIYKALPLRGRGVALAAGALFGSFGSVQYYTWRDSMSKPPEADLDSELKSAKNDSADYKSSTLLVEVVGGWWPWRRKKWRECWAELRNDTLFLFQRRDQDIVGSGSGGGGQRTPPIPRGNHVVATWNHTTMWVWRGGGPRPLFVSF